MYTYKMEHVELVGFTKYYLCHHKTVNPFLEVIFDEVHKTKSIMFLRF